MQTDPYDVFEPKDVLKELGKWVQAGEEGATLDFSKSLESKKWVHRKAALSTLKDLASYPRLASGR